MMPPVITLHEDTHAAELFATFANHGINHVPVTDSAGRLIGIITRLDLLNLFGDPLRTGGAVSNQVLFSKA
jgi:CBS domain-containing protein